MTEFSKRETDLAYEKQRADTNWESYLRIKHKCTELECAWKKREAKHITLAHEYEALKSKAERLAEALRTMVKHEEIEGWDQNPVATLRGLAKEALSEFEGKEKL